MAVFQHTLSELTKGGLPFEIFFGGLLCIIMVLVVMSLLKAKKWAYWLVLVFSGLFSIIIILQAPFSAIAEVSPDIIGGLILSLPFIIFVLLFLDRKNFWKIAS